MNIVELVDDMMALSMSRGYQPNTLTLSYGIYEHLKKEASHYVGNSNDTITFMGLTVEIDVTGTTIMGLKHVDTTPKLEKDHDALEAQIEKLNELFRIYGYF